MRVKFLRDELFESEGRNQGPLYKAGEVHDFTDEFAGRWLRRGAAVEVADEPVAEASAPVASEPPPIEEEAPERVAAEPVAEEQIRRRGRRYR